MFTLGMIPIRPSPQKPAVGDVQGSAESRDVKAQRPLLAASSSAADRKHVSYTAAYVPTIAPTTVLRRNARERNRVKQVNHGFAALRTHVPSAAKNKKMSKVETLRQAVEYIQALQDILRDADSDGPTPQSPAASEDGGSSASVQGLSASPSGSVTPVAPNGDPSPQTLTPASVSSVDSGYTDCSPGYYLSPHDMAAAASAQPVSNTGSLYLPDTQHSHHQQHMLVSPRCPEKHQQHMLVSPRCPEEHQQHMLVSPRCPEELQQLQHHQQMMSAMKHPLVSPHCSDASSPSPSYCSADTPLPASSFDGIGFHDENISPQDEELLDAIAWWQSSQ